jgi:hypothetical protein
MAPLVVGLFLSFASMRERSESVKCVSNRMRGPRLAGEHPPWPHQKVDDSSEPSGRCRLQGMVLVEVARVVEHQTARVWRLPTNIASKGRLRRMGFQGA